MVKQNATNELKLLTENNLQSWFEQLKKHWSKCEALEGNYFKGDEIVYLEALRFVLYAKLNLKLFDLNMY